jgi:hypothetical protein
MFRVISILEREVHARGALPDGNGWTTGVQGPDRRTGVLAEMTMDRAR